MKIIVTNEESYVIPLYSGAESKIMDFFFKLVKENYYFFSVDASSRYLYGLKMDITLSYCFLAYCI